MPEQPSSIVSKVWSLCNPLRDDGVSYGDYLEQLVLAAGSPSGPMAIPNGNTAATPAIFRLGSKVVMAMTEEQFDREKRYQASMNMFQTMLKNGLITEEQYAIIDTKMLEKYRPLLGTLFSESTCYSGLSERCIVPERS